MKFVNLSTVSAVQLELKSNENTETVDTHCLLAVKSDCQSAAVLE